jgi:hypothetical protein
MSTQTELAPCNECGQLSWEWIRPDGRNGQLIQCGGCGYSIVSYKKAAHRLRHATLARRELKAWAAGDSEVGMAIVFAKTARLARMAASDTDECGNLPYIEVRVTREPRADKMANEVGRGIMSWEKYGEFYRSLGWWSLDYSDPQCKDCDKYEFENIPESKLDIYGQCPACREAEDKMRQAVWDSMHDAGQIMIDSQMVDFFHSLKSNGYKVVKI